MAKQVINVGASANDGTGDTLRSSQQKANSNFTELYDYMNTYKSYVAIISQTGTSAPTVNLTLKDEIGGTVAFSYNSVGSYNLAITPNKLTTNKTVVFVGQGNRTSTSQTACILGISIVDDENITINSFNSNGSSFIDGVLRRVPIEIRVYL